MKLNMLIATPLAIASGLLTGNLLWEAHVARKPLPVQFTDRQAGDVAWACRQAHGTPSDQKNGSLVCTPGGGKLTNLDLFLEKDRQASLSEQGK